ncbi:hypothetical protein ACX1M3_00445 [Mycoplasma sp. Z463D]
MIRTKNKSNDYIFKYAIMIKNIFWSNIGITIAFICFIIIWICLQITGSFEDKKGLYVLYGALGTVALIYCTSVVTYFVIGYIARKKILTQDLVQIIFETKSLKMTNLYKNLLRCMYLFKYREKLVEHLNITYEGDE